MKLVSNYGRGRMTARVIRESNGVAYMERTVGKYVVAFSVPVWFLSSPACGWKAKP